MTLVDAVFLLMIVSSTYSLVTIAIGRSSRIKPVVFCKTMVQKEDELGFSVSST